jgi:hypothetical protein
MLSMLAVVYLFFSLIVATKMPGFMFPVAAIGFILMAIGCNNFLLWLNQYTQPIFATVVLGILGILSMQAERIVQFRSSNNTGRNILLANTHIYQQIPNIIGPNVVVFNCKAMQDPAVRFWTPNNAYQLFPESEVMDSLLHNGYKVAAFVSHHNQNLPEFWDKDPRVKKLEWVLQ